MFQEKFPKSDKIVVIDKHNSIYEFAPFEDHMKRYKCHFRLTDLTRDDLYDMGILGIEK